jgi:hypothetical protein
MPLYFPAGNYLVEDRKRGQVVVRFAETFSLRKYRAAEFAEGIRQAIRPKNFDYKQLSEELRIEDPPIQRESLGFWSGMFEPVLESWSGISKVEWEIFKPRNLHKTK